MSVTGYLVPDEIDGTRVEQIERQACEVDGGLWITLAPCDEDDYRLWEFDLRSGRVVQTMDGDA